MARYEYIVNVATSEPTEETVPGFREKNIMELDALSVLDLGSVVPEAIDFESCWFSWDPEYRIVEISLQLNKKVAKPLSVRPAGVEQLVAYQTGGATVEDIDFSEAKLSD